MRFYLPIGKHLLGINLRVSFKKREGNKVVAITNKADHRYCVFLDYDITEWQTIYSDIKGIQKKYELGNAYVFTTKKGYHVIFIDLVSYDACKKIIDDTCCDEHYKIVSRKNNNRQWVLRITPKKYANKVKFYCVVEAKGVYPLSYPHSNYLLAKGVPMDKFNNLKNHFEAKEEDLQFVTYKA